MSIINKIATKSVSYAKIDYSNFFGGINSDVNQKIMPLNSSPLTYNFGIKSGALSAGVGISQLRLPTSTRPESTEDRLVDLSSYDIIAMWLYRNEAGPSESPFVVQYNNFIVFQTSSFNLYFMPVCLSTTAVGEISGIELDEIPTIVNYNINGANSLVICTSKGMWTWRSSKNFAEKHEDVPSIKSMCVHFERLYATIWDMRNDVWFSDDLDPTNWNVSINEGGYVKLLDERGIVNKVLSFNNYLYIFREHGISRLTAFSSQENFSLTNLYTSSGKIFGDSVCACGDRVMMLTQNGLHYFDGYNTNKIDLKIDALINQKQNYNVCSAYVNGKYYLACNLVFNDNQKILCENNYGHVNNVLLEYDISSNVLNILRGVDVHSLCAVTDDRVSKLVACFKDGNNFKVGEVDNSGAIWGNATPKKWSFPLSDLGYANKYKVVKNIYLNANEPITVYVKTENNTKQFFVTPKNGVAKINTMVKGKLVSLEIESNTSNCEISKPSMVVGVV